jgi:hypothetical protein
VVQIDKYATEPDLGVGGEAQARGVRDLRSVLQPALVFAGVVA